MRLHVSDAWLQRANAADLDVETEAGLPIGTYDGPAAEGEPGRDAGRQGSVFALFVRQLRRSHGLTIREMAARVQVDEVELRLIERDPSHRPAQGAIRYIAEAAGVRENVLARLPGLEANDDQFFLKAAFAFVDRSEEAAELTAEEQKAFDNYVRYLKGRSGDADPA